MSAYVSAYSNVNPTHETKVAFTDREDALEFEARWAADMHCQWLQHQRISVEPHFCDFSVVELVDGSFAITCPDHPRRQ